MLEELPIRRHRQAWIRRRLPIRKLVTRSCGPDWYPPAEQAGAAQLRARRRTEVLPRTSETVVAGCHGATPDGGIPVHPGYPNTAAPVSTEAEPESVSPPCME